MDSQFLTDSVVRQLTRRDSSLSEASRDLLSRSLSPPALVKAGEDMVIQGSRPSHSTVILNGWACRYGTLPDGRNQTLALHIRGDFVDLHSFPIKVMDHSVCALTDCTIATIPHDLLRQITKVDPHLTRVLWLHTLVDAAILRQWLLSSAQRTALEHCAHLLCELFTRLQVAELAFPGRPFELPISQIELGAALGITPVHVSRTLSKLRNTGLFTWKQGEALIPDWERLSRLASFDPTYLILTDEPR
ncbi:MAG: Crp/Fnr family transcriptional regulator [Steroidobacteraceae bacterium]